MMRRFVKTALLSALVLILTGIFAAFPPGAYYAGAESGNTALLYRLDFSDEEAVGKNVAGTGYEDAVVPDDNTFTVEQGIKGQNALVFPGGTKYKNYLSLPTAMFEGKDKITVAGWFYLPTGAEAYLGEIGIYSPENAVAFRSDPYANYHGDAYIFCVGKAEGIDLDTRVKPVYDAWYHMAYVIDAEQGVFTVYQNGSAVYETALDADFSPSMWHSQTAHFYIGQSSYSGYENESEHNDYHGKMSDVRVYGDALSAADIKDEYDINVTDFMTAEYTFDQATGIDSVRGYDLIGFNGDPVYEEGTMKISGGAAALFYDKQSGHNVNFFSGHASMTVSMDIKINTPVETPWRRIMDIYATRTNRMTVMSSCAGTEKFETAYCFGGVDRFLLRDSGGQAFDAILHEWFNLTISLEGSDIRVYENGKLKATGVSTPNPTFASLMYDVQNSAEGKAMFGNCPYETFNYIDAEYDNIRIYAAAAKTEREAAAAAEGFYTNNIVYSANDGSQLTLTEKAAVNEPVIIADNTFVRDGYEFVAWNTMPDGSGTTYLPGDEVEIKRDITLYAVWNKVSVIVSFDANGGRGRMPEQVIRENTATELTKNTFLKTGYEFVAWNTIPDGSGDEYSDGAQVVFAADATLYAQWSAKNYTVTFDANGGEGQMQPIALTFDVQTALPENAFTRSGYTFAGWALTPTGIAVYADGETVSGIEEGNDITLYAVWLETGFTVMFDANGGNGEMADFTAAAYAYAALPENAFTRDGYTFGGWATEKNGEVVYEDGADIALTNDITLYAVWEPEPEPELSEDEQGGCGGCRGSKAGDASGMLLSIAAIAAAAFVLRRKDS